MQRLWSGTLAESGRELATIVHSMSGRAAGATQSMLADFEEQHDEYEYFVAWNEQDGEDARFALMSLKAVPGYQGVGPENEIISGSLWVEGLVADAGGGLGGALLAKAEELAAERGRTAVALAAYEYDQGDQGDLAIHEPYSVAGYYAHKGYTFSGEAYQEVDEGRVYTYPIYYKETHVEDL